MGAMPVEATRLPTALPIWPQFSILSHKQAIPAWHAINYPKDQLKPILLPGCPPFLHASQDPMSSFKNLTISSRLCSDSGKMSKNVM
jgi:hypothetical protein